MKFIQITSNIMMLQVIKGLIYLQQLYSLTTKWKRKTFLHGKIQTKGNYQAKKYRKTDFQHQMNWNTMVQ